MQAIVLRLDLGFLGLGFAAALLASCDKPIYTRSFSPIATHEDCKSSADDNYGDFVCSFGSTDSYPPICKVEGTTQIWNDGMDLRNPPYVGFEHKYDSGTGPANCWKTVRSNSRAYAVFDLSTVSPKIGKVGTAALSWAPYSDRYVAGYPSTNPPTFPPHCFRALYENIGGSPGTIENGHRPTGNLISELDETANATKIVGKDLVAVIQKWVNVGWVDVAGGGYGFFFTALDETLTKKENKKCWTALNSLKLEITYTAQ